MSIKEGASGIQLLLFLHIVSSKVFGYLEKSVQVAKKVSFEYLITKVLNEDWIWVNSHL